MKEFEPLATPAGRKPMLRGDIIYLPNGKALRFPSRREAFNAYQRMKGEQ